MGPRVGIGGSRALPYHKVSSPLLWRRFRVAYQIIESLAIGLWYAMCIPESAYKFFLVRCPLLAAVTSDMRCIGRHNL